MVRAQKTDVVAVSIGEATDELIIQILQRELQMRKPDAVSKAESFRDKRHEFYLSCAKSADLAWRREQRDGIVPVFDEFGDHRLLDSERDEKMADDALSAATRAQELIDEYAPKINNHRPNDGGPNAYSAIHEPKRDSIRALFEKRQIDSAQLSAANDIAFVYEEASRIVMSKTQTYKVGSGGGLYDRMSTKVAHRHANCYKPWAEAMNTSGSFNLPFLIDVIVFSNSIKRARTRHRLRHEPARKMVVDSLEKYAALYAQWRHLWEEDEPAAAADGGGHV